MFDALIVGSGPAGLSAAIYTARANLKVLVIGKGKKSQIFKTPKVENYFGVKEISGKELLLIGTNQAKAFGAEIIENEVADIKKADNLFELKTADNKAYQGKVVILAIGAVREKSGIENEEKFVGRGVSYCAKCDAPFFKGKKVVVVGHKNYAAQEALEILPHTKDIMLYTNGKEPEISEGLRKELKKNAIGVKKDKIIKIAGTENVENIILKNKESVPVSAVFIAIGVISPLQLANLLGIEVTDDKKYIRVDENRATNIEGVWAAGDCTGGVMQLGKVVGDGAVAAINAISWLRGGKKIVQW